MIHPSTEVEPLSSENQQEMTQITGEDTNSDHEMVKPIANNSSTKGRKFVSKVWADFEKVKDEGGNEWAVCKHCKRSLVGSSKSGTTHLRNHLSSCRGKRDEVGVGDAENCIKMIIRCGLTSKSIKTGINQLYLDEKEKLGRCLSKLSSRISLTIDVVWIPFDNYICLTGNFIDDSWQLKHKILGLKYLECERDSLKALKGLLLDWKIDNNICSVIAENTDIVDEMKSWLSYRCNSFPVDGELLQFDCLVNILTCNKVNECAFELIQKIRGLFHFVLGTSSNENKFQKAVEKAKSLGKKVSYEDVNPTSLASDFKLLETAVGLKQVFDELEQIDSDFKSMNLTREDWNEAAAVCLCWKELNDFSLSFSECIFPSAHVYFSKVCEVYTALLQWEKNEWETVQRIGSSIRKAFVNGYWTNSILVLAIMVVLDPRFKMDTIEHWYKKIFGNDHVTHLMEIIVEITGVYNKYSRSAPGASASSSASRKMLRLPADDGESSNSELDVYVKEPKCPLTDDFDVLTWWRMNAQNFPILARMARDFLAIPFSTALANPALKAKMQNLLYSVDFGPCIREAYICTKCWLLK